jgi:hypothetical protein
MKFSLISLLMTLMVKKCHQYQNRYHQWKDIKSRTVKFSTWLGNEYGVTAFAEAKAIYQPQTDTYDLTVKYSKLGAADSIPMNSVMTRPEFEDFYRRFA